MTRRIVVFGSLALSLIKFRYQLLDDLVQQGNEVIACAPDADEEIIAKLKEINVRYQHISISRTGLNPFIDFLNVLKMRKIFKQLNPDIVLSYTIKPAIYGSMAAYLAGVKNIYSMITGLGYSFTSRGLKPRIVNGIVCLLLKVSLSTNKIVFFQNPDDIAIFLDKRILKSRAQSHMINGSGVDLDHYPYTPLSEQCSFLLIARLIKDKGIVEYVEAAKLVKLKYPDTKFYLAGWIDTNPSAIKQESLDEWISEGVIDFLGKLSDVRPTIANCSVYVLPSYREGTPRTVLEAMAMGRPIITTDAPGCRETVIDGFNGYLVPIRSISPLAEKMIHLIESTDVLENMAQNSYNIAKEKYDVHKVNQDICSVMNL